MGQATFGFSPGDIRSGSLHTCPSSGTPSHSAGPGLGKDQWAWDRHHPRYTMRCLHCSDSLGEAEAQRGGGLVRVIKLYLWVPRSSPITLPPMFHQMTVSTHSQCPYLGHVDTEEKQCRPSVWPQRMWSGQMCTKQFTTSMRGI